MSAEFPTNPVELTQRLIQIPSDKNHGEAALVKYMNSWVAENAPAGFRADVVPTADPNRPSLMVANSSVPRLIVMSHIDTVPAWTVGEGQNQGQFDPFGGTLEKGRVYGRGAADAKSAVATMLSGLAEFSKSPLDLPAVALVFPSDEEGKFLGSDAIHQKFSKTKLYNPGYQPTFVLSTNGNDGEVSYGCRGLFEIIAEIQGRTGHSAIRKPNRPDPISAFEVGISAYQRIKDLLEVSGKTILGKTIINAAAGEYGLLSTEGKLTTSYNSVPDLYRAHFEFRTNGGKYPDGKNIDAPTTAELLSEFAFEAGGRLDATIRQERAAWLADRKDGGWFEEILKDVTGKNKIPEWVYGQHGYDEIAILMEVLNKGNKALIPSAIWGVVESGQFHEVDESVRVEDIKIMGDVLTRTYASPELKRRTFSTPS